MDLRKFCLKRRILKLKIQKLRKTHHIKKLYEITLLKKHRSKEDLSNKAYNFFKTPENT